MTFIKPFFNLFYPDTCIHCKEILYTTENIICIKCRNELPVITILDSYNNKIKDVFYGKFEIQKAYSFFYYRKEGITNNLIYNLKYNNREDIGIFLGSWFGHILKEKNIFNDIDYLIPVPLHKKRLRQRGYNQISSFAHTLSSTLSIDILPEILSRTHFTKTQTQKTRLHRFLNMENRFTLNNTSILENKHILLIDDVVTTGATLYACCKELGKTKNINISIVTIAFTEQN